MLKDRLKANPVPVQLPIGKEANFEGIVDLVKMKAYVYKDQFGITVEETEIPEEMKELCIEYKGKLVEAIAEQDEGILEEYLEGIEPSEEEIKAAIRDACLKVKIIPVTCGSSYRNKGVQQLLDAIVDYLPSPLDVPPVSGVSLNGDEEIERKANDDEPFSALAFKIMVDPYVGKLCFFRVYSGKLSAGSYIMNPRKDKKERIGRLLRIHANHREEIETVYSGDIAAAVGMKETTTGDTMCDPDNPIVLESMEFPEPVISIAIEPKTKLGEEKMAIALKKLAEEDPTFKTHTDLDSGQTIISGMGELHLEIIVDRMLREFKVEANIGKPQVSYRETIRKAVKQDGKFIRQSGGRGQYGHCVIEIEPSERGSGYIFENKIVGGVIPKDYIPAVDAGIRDAMQTGVLGGYQVMDVKVTLVDGSYHEVDSSELAFKIAGSMAFKDACRKADPVLLEPIMRVDIAIPEDYLGDVMGDITSRRGKIDGMEARLSTQVISASVPLAQMFGYATELRSRTQGRGTFTMQFSRYEEVPSGIQKQIIG